MFPSQEPNSFNTLNSPQYVILSTGCPTTRTRRIEVLGKGISSTINEDMIRTLKKETSTLHKIPIRDTK